MVSGPKPVSTTGLMLLQSTTSPPQQNINKIQYSRQKITQQEEMINDLKILTKHLLQRIDEMSKA